LRTRTYLDSDEVSEWVKDNYPNQWKAINELDESERKALQWYKGPEGEDFTNYLRTGTSNVPGLHDEFDKYADTIDDLINASRIDQDTLLHRGVKFQRGDSLDDLLRVGTEFGDDAFTSTTLDERLAQDFAEGGGAVLDIRAPQGTRGIFMDFTDEAIQLQDDFIESEFLLPRSIEFRVVERVTDGVAPGIDRIVLELIDG